MRDHNLPARDQQRKKTHHRDPVRHPHYQSMPRSLRNTAPRKGRSIGPGRFRIQGLRRGLHGWRIAQNQLKPSRIYELR
jgi:hypothetical protein